MKRDDMTDTVIMIVMWYENKARLSEPENFEYVKVQADKGGNDLWNIWL